MRVEEEKQRRKKSLGCGVVGNSSDAKAAAMKRRIFRE